MNRATWVIALLAWSLPASAETTRPVHAVAPTHVGEVLPGRVEWRSEYTTAPLYETTDGVENRWSLHFAVPLPADAEIVFDSTGPQRPRVALLRGADRRIVAVTVTGAHSTLRLLTTIPANAESLDPPYAQEVGQRVEVHGARLVWREPSPISMGLSADTHRALSWPTTGEIDLKRGQPHRRAVYLIPDSAFVESGGLTPFLIQESEIHGYALGGLIAALGLLLAALGFGLRRISHRASGEAADAFLAQQDERLAQDFARIGEIQVE